MYADAIKDETDKLYNCVGFIDGTVTGIARATGYETQMVLYNGHKRKHSLKCQVVNSPDGLILHAYGPTEVRRHDWTLYVRSGLDEQLPDILDRGGKGYCIYGDSGYSRRWYIELLYQGSNLSAAERAVNKTM